MKFYKSYIEPILCKIPSRNYDLHRGSLNIRTTLCKNVVVVVRLFVALTTTSLTTLLHTTKQHRSAFLCVQCKMFSNLLNYIEHPSMFGFSNANIRGTFESSSKHIQNFQHSTEEKTFEHYSQNFQNLMIERPFSNMQTKVII